MADKFPLIIDSTTNQIKEIENGDNLNLSGNNIINAGIITANSYYGDGSNLTGVGIGSTGDINTSGIITANSFYGDGSNLTGVGIGSTGDINTSGIITASAVYAEQFEGFGDELIFSPTITSFSPTDGSTDVYINTNIVLTFDQPIYAGVGSVFLRDSSSTGDVIEEIDINSSMINNQTLTINPSSNLPIETDVYVVLPQGVVKNYVGGNNALLDTYNFTIGGLPELGDPYEGGYLICQQFDVQWIVAPLSTEVSRNWYSINDAVTTAESNAPCGDWFVPTCGRLKNPGWICRNCWDSYSSTIYWSSTKRGDTNEAWRMNFDSCNGNINDNDQMRTFCVRAFRCVAY